MVQVKLAGDKKRPSFYLPCEARFTCLIDTGALISVWCLNTELLLYCYPDAVKTQYCTTVSGFGGKSVEKREIWKIPEFTLTDMNGNGTYTIKNLLVAIVEAETRIGFSMVLTSLVFRGSYHIFGDIDDENKRIEIYPKYDRPVYCLPIIYTVSEAQDKGLTEMIDLQENETLIEGITVLSEEPPKNEESGIS